MSVTGWSTILPQVCRHKLFEALRVDPGVPAGESAERTRLLNNVILSIKLHYPKYFKKGRI